MRITFKKYKTCRSTDGDAFSADVYLDGKKACEVSNSGTGGPNMYHWYNAALEADFMAYAKEQHPDMKYEAEDMLIEDAINAFEEERTLKRWCKNKIVLKPKDAEPGQFITIAAKWDPKHRDAILARDPGAEIVNERFC